MSDKIPSFSDFSISKKNLSGDRIDIKEVMGKDIVVTGYKSSKSKFYHQKGNDEYTRIQFYFCDDDTKERRVIFTSSNILIEQLMDIEEELESRGMDFLFKTKVTRVSNYYSFA